MTNQAFRKDRPELTTPESRLGLSRGMELALIAGMSAIGALLGWGAPPVARWLGGLGWVPFGFVLDIVGAPQGPWPMVGVIAGAGVAGLVLGVVICIDCLMVTMDDDEIRFHRHLETTSAPRAGVAAVFVDDRDLVVLAHDSSILLRGHHESESRSIAEACAVHGFPWRNEDPFADSFHRWVAGTGDLPPGVDALLVARERVLKKKDHNDADELRTEIERAGFTVREEKHRQYWRPLTPLESRG